MTDKLTNTFNGFKKRIIVVDRPAFLKKKISLAEVYD
jgi:hypothetical protein